MWEFVWIFESALLIINRLFNDSNSYFGTFIGIEGMPFVLYIDTTTVLPHKSCDHPIILEEELIELMKQMWY